MPVYTIFGLILKRDSISARCSWKRHSEERSTEDVVLLGAVLRVLPNSVSGSVCLGARPHKWVRAPIKWVRAPKMMGAHSQGWGRALIKWGRALLEKGLFQKCHNEL